MLRREYSMFFKFMMPGFSEKLSLPPAFLRHLSSDECEKAILKSSLGKSWQVKFCRSKEGSSFGDGWFDFVLDHELQLGDCLVFCYEGAMIFHVTVFDTSCCVKNLGTKNDERRGILQSNEGQLRRGMICRRSSVEAVETHSSNEGNHQHFIQTIVPSNLVFIRPYLILPAKFRKAMAMKRIRQMVLIDPEGRSWPVQITHRLNSANTLSYFSTGWNNFQKANGLKVGDTCIFELADAQMKTMNVHITRKPSYLLDGPTSKRPRV